MSAKIFILVCATPGKEFQNTPWVKSEWMRFKKRIQVEKDNKLLLIPVTDNGFSPDELPRALKGFEVSKLDDTFNERTQKDAGLIIPVIITIYQDRSFTFILKTPPAPVLIKKACGLESASAVPNKQKVATLKKEDLAKIAEMKMPDLNAADLEAAKRMIAGTARSMGVLVEE